MNFWEMIILDRFDILFEKQGRTVQRGTTARQIINCEFHQTVEKIS